MNIRNLIHVPLSRPNGHHIRLRHRPTARYVVDEPWTARDRLLKRHATPQPSASSLGLEDEVVRN